MGVRPGVGVAILWCRLVLREEVEMIEEERVDMLWSGVAAVGDCHGRVDEGTCELCCRMRSHAPSHFIRRQRFALP